MSDAVRLVELRDEPIDLAEVYAAVTDAGVGGVAVFVGTVRDVDSGRPVEQLSYSAHPTAEQDLRSLVELVTAEADLISVAAVHRVGDLDIGDIAVVVAAAAAHRGAALTACARLIDELKAAVPIWKHQRFRDGTEEWVGTP